MMAKKLDYSDPKKNVTYTGAYAEVRRITLAILDSYAKIEYDVYANPDAKEKGAETVAQPNIVVDGDDYLALLSAKDQVAVAESFLVAGDDVANASTTPPVLVKPVVSDDPTN